MAVPMIGQIYIDGACHHPPVPGKGAQGGFGVVAYCSVDGVDQILHEDGYSAKRTTNNRMELMAALGAIAILNNQWQSYQGIPGVDCAASKIEIFTDSLLVCNGINQWLYGWQARGWRRRDGALTNADVWQWFYREWIAINSRYQIEVKWVKGHSGIPGNVRADKIAGEFADAQNRSKAVESLNLIQLDHLVPNWMKK